MLTERIYRCCIAMYAYRKNVGGSLDERLADDKVMCTAVGQLASFCLLSLQSDAFRGVSLEKASQAAEATLQTWREPKQFELSTNFTVSAGISSFGGSRRMLAYQETKRPIKQPRKRPDASRKNQNRKTSGYSQQQRDQPSGGL